MRRSLKSHDFLTLWWASLRRIGARVRPVDIPKSAFLLLLAVVGLILMITGAGEVGPPFG